MREITRARSPSHRQIAIGVAASDDGAGCTSATGSTRSRRRDGAEHPGDDGGPGQVARRRDDRDAHAVAAGSRPASRRADAPRARRPTSRTRSARPRSCTCTASGRPRPGAVRGRPVAAGSLPDRRARHGRALGAAAQVLEEAVYMALVEGKNPPPCLVPARPVAARDRPPADASPHGRRSASSPTASTSRPSMTCRAGRPSKPSTPSCAASSCCSSSAGCMSRRGSTCWPRPWPGRRRPSGPPSPARRQRRGGLGSVPDADGSVGLDAPDDLPRPCLGRAGPAGLGGGRRLRPAQLQRRLQHGDPRGPGLPAPLPDHHRLPLPRAGRGRRGRRRRADGRRRDPRPPRAARARPGRARELGTQRPAAWSSESTPGTARPSGWPPSTTGSPAAVHRPKSCVECPEVPTPAGHDPMIERSKSPRERRSMSTATSPVERDRPRQERGREPAPMPARPGLGRRGLRRRQPEHRRDGRRRRRARRDGRPVPLQRDLSQEEELGAREPAVPQRVGPDRRRRRGRRPRAGRGDRPADRR